MESIEQPVQLTDIAEAVDTLVGHHTWAAGVEDSRLDVVKRHILPSPDTPSYLAPRRRKISRRCQRKHGSLIKSSAIGVEKKRVRFSRDRG